MNEPVHFLDIIRLIYKRRMWIITLCGVTGLASAIITLLKPDYYKSTTTFYAASDDLSSPEKIFGLTNEAMQYYGTDSDADRLLSTGASAEFKEDIIRHFNLYQHYKIDTSKHLFRVKALKEFSKNYSLQRNKFDAIELSIEDTDPVLAAKMTNYARKSLNEMSSKMIKSSQGFVLNSLKKEIQNQETLLSIISDSLNRTKAKYGIVNPEIQSEKFASQYGKLITKIREDSSKLNYLNKLVGNYRWKRDSIAKINLRLETNQDVLRLMNDESSDEVLSMSNFSKGSNAVVNLETYFSDVKNKLVQTKIRQQNVKSVYESLSQSIILVEEGATPDKKSRPRRSIIVIGATLAAFVFGVLGVLLHAAYARFDWTQIKS